MADGRTYEYGSRNGDTHKVRLRKASYASNRTIAVHMESEGDASDGELWEPYAMLTVNVPPASDGLAGTNKAFVDTNNLGRELIGWLEDNGIAKATGTAVTSGYCAYPQVEFSDDAFWD